MKNTYSLITLALLLFISTSCNNTKDQSKQPAETQQESEPYGRTPALPDSLQLDSLTSDSVDYNQPESPRM